LHGGLVVQNVVIAHSWQFDRSNFKATKPPCTISGPLQNNLNYSAFPLGNVCAGVERNTKTVNQIVICNVVCLTLAEI